MTKKHPLPASRERTGPPPPLNLAALLDEIDGGGEREKLPGEFTALDVARARDWSPSRAGRWIAAQISAGRVERADGKARETLVSGLTRPVNIYRKRKAAGV